MSLSYWAQHTPDAPAVIMTGSGESLSFLELDARSNQGAHLFRELGLVAGDHIAIMIENQPLFYVLCWAAMKSGLVYTPISTFFAAEDAGYVLSDCGALAFVATSQMMPVAADAAEIAPLLRHKFLSGGARPGFSSWEAAIARMPTEPIDDPAQGVDMSYSSGTTGLPKGVLRTPQEVPGDIATVMRRGYPGYGFTSATRYLVPNPVYHSAPMRFSMIVQMLGGTVLLMEHFDPEKALLAIERHRATHALFVPTMFIKMLRLDPDLRAGSDLSSLKSVVHAAAPCPVPVKEAMIEWWGPIIYEFYGSTEECGFTTIGSDEWRKRTKSVGRPTLGSFHVLDDHGLEMPSGHEGTIWVGDISPFSYFGDPSKTAEATNDRGWQSVGDIGYVDAEGYVYLTGRNAFTINSGGVKISSKEVEDALATHPFVVEAAVFGVPDPEFGEQIKAVVQLHDHKSACAQTERMLIEHCRAHLSRLKAPKSIDFEETLPRDAVGKLLKKALKARYVPVSAPAGRA